jgi:hypothetical protein
VLGGGVALGGIGGLAYLAARSNYAAHAREVAQHCEFGCNADEAARYPAIATTLDRGRIEQDIAFTLFAAGGLAVLTGAIGVVFNQPRVVVDVSRPVPAVPAFRPARGGATVSVIWRY